MKVLLTQDDETRKKFFVAFFGICGNLQKP
jgi:hypothetical protein